MPTSPFSAQYRLGAFELLGRELANESKNAARIMEGGSQQISSGIGDAHRQKISDWSSLDSLKTAVSGAGDATTVAYHALNENGGALLLDARQQASAIGQRVGHEIYKYMQAQLASGGWLAQLAADPEHAQSMKTDKKVRAVEAVAKGAIIPESDVKALMRLVKGADRALVGLSFALGIVETLKAEDKAKEAGRQILPLLVGLGIAEGAALLLTTAGIGATLSSAFLAGALVMALAASAVYGTELLYNWLLDYHE